MHSPCPGSRLLRGHGIRVVQIFGALFLTSAIAGVAHANWPHNPAVNVPVCKAGGDQTYPSVCPDGNGGAYIAWSNDLRNAGATGSDVYVHHIAASGVLDATWPVDGLPVCTLQGDQVATSCSADDTGGFLVLWEDSQDAAAPYQLHAQRVSVQGVSQWTTNGVLVCNQACHFSQLISDGTGGAIVVWADKRSGNFDIYAQRLNASGVPQWTPNGVTICGATGNQALGRIVSDGAGGAIIVWDDHRGADVDVYAQRVNSAGTTLWSSDGILIAGGAFSQVNSWAVSDGLGGAIVTWNSSSNGIDFDMYAQRVNAQGQLRWLSGGSTVVVAPSVQAGTSIAPDGSGGAVITWWDARSTAEIYAQKFNQFGIAQWPANGIKISTSTHVRTGSLDYTQAVPDGSGGAIVTWADVTSGTSDIVAQHVTSSGSIPGSWPAFGRVVCNALNDQDFPFITASLNGRVIIAWNDHRSGTDSDIYAQLVAPSGFLAVPNPTVRPARDLPFDQGGFVNVPWDASYLDTDEPYVVDHYWVTRTAPPDVLAAATALGRVFTPEDWGAAEVTGGAPPGLPSVIVTGTGATASYWEPLQRVDALHSVPSYDAVAPTTSDSTAAGNPLTSFMVIAYDPTGAIALASDPATGYSVDNLPPATPGHFTADPASGLTRLHWGTSPDRDLAGYRVYGGGTPDFTPGPTNLIASLPDTEYTDPAVGSAWYKLSAVDIHGNESPYAVAQGFATESVDGSLARELSLSRPAPNPARRAAAIALTLPHAAHARLAIFDVAGRLERTLLDGAMAPGAHTIPWDLRDEAGAAARAGLYFVRLESEGRSLTQRLVVAGL